MRTIRRNPASAGAGIHVEGLTKAFRGRPVLKDVHLQVENGTVAVLEGANGAGKTTLIRVLATVVRPDAGTATVDGYDVVGHGAMVRRRTGVMFVNDRSLYWRLRPVANLRLFGRLSDVPEKDLKPRIAELLDALGLSHVLHLRAGALSTGQRQRLMLARALLGRPSVLLVDEPLRGLDDEGMHRVLGLLAGQAEQGSTVLVAAPMIDELRPIAAACYRLGQGRLERELILPAAGRAPEAP